MLGEDEDLRREGDVQRLEYRDLGGRTRTPTAVGRAQQIQQQFPRQRATLADR